MSRHFLIDGYNVLHKMPQGMDGSLEDNRKGLIRYIRDNRPQGSGRNAVTIVFDGRDDVVGMPTGSDVRVLFSSGESADDVIQRLVRDDSNSRTMIVVTDDRDLGTSCRALGADLWSVAEFLAQGKKIGARLRSGGTPKRSNKSETKVVSHALESKVNRELGELWLKKRA